MSLEDIATELYGLPPEEFTAARNARAKEARQAGDKELAQQIAGLGKPTTVGWLANQLVRERPDELRALLDLGGSLREATANLAGDELKELSRQQRRVVHALVQQARSLASAAGHPASEDTARGLEETLHAALADQGAADQLAGGRLTGVLSRSGFPGSAAPPSRPVSSRRTAAAGEERDVALERAQRDEELARQAAEDTAAERDRARAALDAAGTALTEATERAEELRRELAEAGEVQLAAQREVRAARDAADKADRLARRAAQRLADAEQRRQRLAG